MKQLRIALEGNIGAGKTTLLTQLASDSRITIFPEPMQDWRNEPDGPNYLDLYYNNPKEYAFLFQTRTLTSLIKRHNLPFSTPVAIYDRSIQASRIFRKLLRFKKYLTEIEDDTLQYLDDVLTPDLPDYLLYLKASPAKCLGRVLTRSRSEEKGIDLQFLKKLHDLHEDWIAESNIPTFILDGHQTPDKVLAQTKEVLNNIFEQQIVECFLPPEQL